MTSISFSKKSKGTFPRNCSKSTSRAHCSLMSWLLKRQKEGISG